MNEPARTRVCRYACEAVMLAMACLAPWAFGATDAWAELGLNIGLALVVVLGFLGQLDAGRPGLRINTPSLALAGLVVLGLAQAAPIPDAALRWASPATASLRASLVPMTPERVVGDPNPPVPLPPSTIGQDPEAALRMAMRLAAAWLLFQGVLGLSPGAAPLRRFGLATMINATVMSLFSLIQMLTWNGKIYWIRPSPAASSGPFITHSHLAAYLNLGLGFALAALLAPGSSSGSGRGVNARLWPAYSAGLIAIGILASLSRNGFLGMLVGLAVIVLVLRPRARQLGLALGIASVLIGLLLLVLGDEVPYRERIMTLLGSKAYNDRMQIWADALRIWPHYPVLGTGLASFPVVMPRFSRHTQHLGNVFFGHAENEYIEWLVEGGLVGFGLYLTLVVGVVGLAWRALKAARSPGERALILGACFGGIAILVESVGDFALDVPGVTVSVVILCGHLTRLGLEARGATAAEGASASAAPSFLSALSPASLTAPILGIFLLLQGIALARSEAAYQASGRTWPGRGQPVRASADYGIAQLRYQRDQVERALLLRPNWAEGYQELGMIYLGLFEVTNEQYLRTVIADPAARAWISRNLILHGQVHGELAGKTEEIQKLIATEGVQAYLVPAARAFLEARRCCYLLPLPHAELAAMDYLLEGAAPPDVLVERALRLSGANSPLLVLVEQLALQLADPDLLIRIMRRELSFQGVDWPRLASWVGLILPPDLILARVVPNGRFAILFGDYLYSAPENRAIRERFVREGLRRLPSDQGLSPAAKLHLEARAWAALGDRTQARDRMDAALMRAPRMIEWRKELVEWLIRWGQLEDARGQALIGVALTPDRPEAKQAMELANEALARGGPAVDTP
jgi:hypothetical protein